MNDTNQQDTGLLPSGLSAQIAAQRLLSEGPNELGVSQRRALAEIVLEVLREPMFLLLLAAGGIYLLMGDRSEALTLLGFVVVIIGITVLQERRTDNALAALRELSSPRARVMREGEAVRIPGREVVREDVLLLAEGDRVPADGLLLQAHELAADESMLTGESLAVAKSGGDTVYAGTLIVGGQAVARVTATGSRTEMGRIGVSLDDIHLQASPLREEMTRLTRRLAAIGVLLSVALTVMFWWLREGGLQGVLAGIGLAMSLLPQEFAVIMIVFFAMAARRLATQHVLTRRLHAIESLGETTVLCVDKTGTLTQNRMQVAALCAEGQRLMLDQSGEVTNLQASDAEPSHLPGHASVPEAFHELIRYAVLASEIVPHDPMEQAIHQLGQAQLGSGQPLPRGWTLAREYELSPALLAMTHLWQSDAHPEAIVAAKGAPEAIAQLCRLDEAGHARVAQEAEALAAQGLRVLAVARARHPSGEHWPDTQQAFDFQWLGLVALADPLRPEVPAAIARCKRAGIRVVMITGDHPRTATAIAHQAGLLHADVITGDELTRMDSGTLAARVRSVNVFARVRPHQKLALVEALKAQGEVVAMTGDGVNDAPALKAAHIGIAMGQRGTDVAREASSLVLLRDDFTSIMEAIRMGRRTYANMRQAMVYTVAVHVPIAGLALLPVIFGLPLLLAPLHIAFLELVIDPACSVVFEAEEGPPTLMEQPPRSTRESMLAMPQVMRSLAYGGLTTLAVFLFYLWQLAQGDASVAAAAAFVMLVTANAVLILPARAAGGRSTPKSSRLTPTTVWVLGATALALWLATGWAPLASAFRFAPLPVSVWMTSLALGLLMLPVFGIVARVMPSARH